MRWSAALALLAALPGWAQLTAPGDPAALTDLRWLARPGGNDRVVNTGAGMGLKLDGPGVLDYLVYGDAGELVLVVDGEEVLRATPRADWKPLYVEPERAAWGTLPFAWPLVHLGGTYACCSVPIPFARSLQIEVSRGAEQLFASWRRLDAPPAMAFGDETWTERLAVAHEYLAGDVGALPPAAGAREVRVQAHCAAGGSATLAELSGPGEMVGMRLRMIPGALELLRHQVIAITADGLTSVRMPLVDLVGVSHPWPLAWQPRAGDQVAGIVHPYARSGGRIEEAVVAYCKLPIPFTRSLRIELHNRASGLTASFDARLLVLPLEDAAGAGRLCGASVRTPLAAEGETELFALPGAGRLVGLSAFTTGHGRDWAWRRESQVQLDGPDGSIAGGFGLLPLGMQGGTGSSVIATLAWNHNSLQPTGRAGAGRHFWTDPLDLPRGARITWQAAGADGPTHAEVGVLWYAPPGEPPLMAPEVPADVVALPLVYHGQPGEPQPGGWWDEAEALAAAAEASAGEVRAETTGAEDAFASGGAYLAWNAERPGDYLDLLVPVPASRYVRLWVHRLLFRSGGSFAISLAAPDDAGAGFGYSKDPAGYLDRVLGRATAKASVECYDVWPHRQAYRFEMPPMLSPARGGVARLRFTCITRPSGSRGYLLALDQLGLDPAPPTEDGWHEFESAPARVVGTSLGADLMAYGRADFSGWGGRELRTERTGEAAISLVGPAGPAAGAVEVRGLAFEGAWTARAGGEEVTLASPEGAREPSSWLVPVPAGEATLVLRCTAGPGRLLLDAWRQVAE